MLSTAMLTPSASRWYIVLGTPQVSDAALTSAVRLPRSLFSPLPPAPERFRRKFISQYVRTVQSVQTAVT